MGGVNLSSGEVGHGKVLTTTVYHCGTAKIIANYTAEDHPYNTLTSLRPPAADFVLSLFCVRGLYYTPLGPAADTAGICIYTLKKLKGVI